MRTQGACITGPACWGEGGQGTCAGGVQGVWEVRPQGEAWETVGVRLCSRELERFQGAGNSGAQQTGSGPPPIPDSSIAASLSVLLLDFPAVSFEERKGCGDDEEEGDKRRRKRRGEGGGEGGRARPVLDALCRGPQLLLSCYLVT